MSIVTNAVDFERNLNTQETAFGQRLINFLLFANPCSLRGPFC
jgi:hypothetical protein